MLTQAKIGSRLKGIKCCHSEEIDCQLISIGFVFKSFLSRDCRQKTFTSLFLALQIGNILLDLCTTYGISLEWWLVWVIWGSIETAFEIIRHHSTDLLWSPTFSIANKISEKSNSLNNIFSVKKYKKRDLQTLTSIFQVHF